jgi:anaerobic selenocysteine-containing dehydrogenase
MAPSGFSVKQLREHQVGLPSNAQTRHKKYAQIDGDSRQQHGFNTPCGKIEIYSSTFARTGYSALPRFEPRKADNDSYPLTLTFFRDIHFCDEQHRNIPRLRRAVPEPFLEIHPSTAAAQGINDGAWIFLETANGKVKLKARLNDSLHPSVVATVYGWWQACAELKLDGQDPFSANGANTNLLVTNVHLDPISASVAHRAQRCRIRKA